MFQAFSVGIADRWIVIGGLMDGKPLRIRHRYATAQEPHRLLT